MGWCMSSGVFHDFENKWPYQFHNFQDDTLNTAKQTGMKIIPQSRNTDFQYGSRFFSLKTIWDKTVADNDKLTMDGYWGGGGSVFPQITQKFPKHSNPKEAKIVTVPLMPF
jgi:hypothetical protein